MGADATSEPAIIGVYSVHILLWKAKLSPTGSVKFSGDLKKISGPINAFQEPKN